MRSGTYRAVSDDLVAEIRVESTAAGRIEALSGDLNVGTQFIASFFCVNPAAVSPGAGGPVEFRGNSRLSTGHIQLQADERGIGVFQLAVDLEGGHQDIIAGRAEWIGSFLRRLTIEVDGFGGMPFFDSYVNAAGRTVSVQSAFAAAGFDVQIVADPFLGSPSQRNRANGFSFAEIHRAMLDRRSAGAPGRMRTHVFVATYLSGRNGRNVLGVMYDFSTGDINRRPREGVAIFGHHPMLSDPRVSEANRRREFVYTLIHETGHALNLLHSFDKGRPGALSWMNYPQLYPFGAEAPQGHDGSAEFWNAFDETFDSMELRHLRHATPREVSGGGLPFGVYEEGPTFIYGGSVNPRLTRLGSNPLRETPNVELQVGGPKRYYHLGEPVFVELLARGRGRGARIPDALDPSEGFTRFLIEKPDGSQERYAPPMRVCMQAPVRDLESALEVRSHAIPLSLGAAGPVFRNPGRYRIWGELSGVDGNRVAFAEPWEITVVSPDADTQKFADLLWNNPGAMATLYLRHPLADYASWKQLEEDAKRCSIAKKTGNTTAAYMGFVSALGWTRPFQRVGLNEAPANPDKVAPQLGGYDAEDLPTSVKSHIERLRQAPKTKAKVTIPGARPEDLFREQIPPNGIFGNVALDRPDQAPAGPVSPFLVLPSLKGRPGFADIVTWNIQHLHGTKASRARIAKIAEYMEAFRCDFWGLQEVQEAALADLVKAINARGNLTYDFHAVSGNGQQSACVFRTDTTRVRVLSPTPANRFDKKIEVTKKGTKQLRPVFDRTPLLCDVRVQQSSGKVFDFRCAVVHTKATDSSLRDKGNSLRLAASKLLEKWVADGLDEGAESDFLVMGDMNAEQANQGLEAFAKSKKMKLLSVGMNEKHGTEGPSGAITRFASGRLLDHIAVTSDSVALMPKGDEKEQIIIRSDISVEGFTKPVKGSSGPLQQFVFSDHLPVAVRFVLGADKD